MSKGSKLPALPPKSGCRACGVPHFELCPTCAEAIGTTPTYIRSPTCLRCGCEKGTYGSAHLCSRCDLASLPPAKPMTAEDRRAYEDAMEADIGRDIDARKRRMCGVGR